jgi:hypothetical protein
LRLAALRDGQRVIRGHTPFSRPTGNGPIEDVTRVTTVRQRRVYPGDPGSYAAAQRVDSPAMFCDEVLAARLAGGLLRLEWLGAAIERLLRRVIRRPGG